MIVGQAYLLGAITCLYATTIAIFTAKSKMISFMTETSLYGLSFGITLIGVMFTVMSLYYFVSIGKEQKQ